MKAIHTNSWPIKLMLISQKLECLENETLLLAADCTAFACKNFHNKYIKEHTLLVFCPRLEDKEELIEKLSEIFIKNKVKKIDIIRMTLPCCIIQKVVQQALEKCELFHKNNCDYIKPEINIKVINPDGFELMPSLLK